MAGFLFNLRKVYLFDLQLTEKFKDVSYVTTVRTSMTRICQDIGDLKDHLFHDIDYPTKLLLAIIL